MGDDTPNNLKLEEKEAGTESSELGLEPETQAQPAPPPRSISGWKWGFAYCSLLSVTFLFSLDNTIVAAIQPSILESLGSVNLLAWIGVGFPLGSTCVLAFSKAYGVFNIKWLFIFHVLLFEVGSVICGAAPNMPAMIFGRVIAGVGGCGMYSGSLTYLAAMTSMAERPLYTAGVAVAWGLGSVLGPVVGAGFAESGGTWRWGFYINILIGAVFAPSYIFLLPGLTLQNTAKTIGEKLKMVDFVSIIIFAGGAACFNMAITFSGSVFAWSSGSAIALWVMVGVLLIAQIVTALWHPGVSSDHRLIPVHFFKRPVILNLGLQMALVSGTMMGFVYYIPLFFAFTRGDAPIQAGVRLLPFVALLVFGAITSGSIMPKNGLYMPWYVAGAALVTIGCGLMYTVETNTPPANVYGYTILAGLGVGFYVMAGVGVNQALVEPHDIPNAVGWQAVTQVIGAIGYLSVAGNIFYNTAVSNIRPLLPADTDISFIADLIAGTSGEAFKSLSPEVTKLVIDALTKSMRNVWIWFLSGGALSFVLSLFLKRERLTIPG
ncbi:major facilitator superfamily domain-containing protein [Dichotomopilus funicola]|uniref:Major facilitator superfamily domain-containing protein n=1 Tax=Dichotomopilus funicola TaxID=1934379 RepID=A0AAN6UZD3_9PEZI|nr:major facilitator superfamily domain-containing protein [Dichotomopilus funicola]